MSVAKYEPGFYWVRLRYDHLDGGAEPQPEIAERTETSWRLIGFQGWIPPESVDVISPRLEPPK